MRYLAMFLFALPLHAQAVTSEGQARLFINASVAKTRATYSEQAGCVASYRTVRDTIVLSIMEPANLTRSDSITIWAPENRLCPAGMPTFHTHLLPIVYPFYPSCIDSMVAKQRHVAWNVLADTRPDSNYYLMLYHNDSTRTYHCPKY